MNVRRFAAFCLPFFLAACSALSDLPKNADEAFSLPEVPYRGNTRMETFKVRATMDQVKSAAQYALAASGFEERKETWTDDRRCGERTTSANEWGMWACIYFKAAGSDTTVEGRIIVESWNSLGAKSEQPWQLHIANAFHNRLRSPG